MFYFINFSIIFYFLFFFFFLNFIFLLLALDHFIITLIFLDLLLLTNIIIFTIYTILTDIGIGYSFGLLIIGVAAADTAIGLGLFILYYKSTGKYLIN